MNVFLSYSSSEDVLAERLAYRLRDENYSVFFDRTSLVPGEGYDSRIRSAIGRSNLFIFLISRESISAGSYALTELGIAQHKWASPSGRILPVMVSEVDLDTLPPYLNSVTVLRPQGDLVAEVMAVVSRLRQRRRVRVYWALVLFFSVLVSGSVLFRWANERFNSLPPPPAVPNAEPVKVISMLTNSGWVLNFDILRDGPIKEIFYRFGDEDTFKSTGFTRVRDPKTGLVQPTSYIEVPLFKSTRTLLVKYTDSAGRENGPYRVVLDPVKQIVAETKDILKVTESSWVSFREYPKGRMLLYFTHLVSYKNGLKEIQYSVDKESLASRVRFTPDWSGPGAPRIRDDDETLREISMSAKFVYVKLVFIDGSEWPAKRFAIARAQ